MKARKVDYKSFFIIFCILAFTYMVNFYMPLSFGDDMAYQLCWPEGHQLTELFQEKPAFLSSLGDVISSTYNHYFSWHGRITGAFFMFFAGWIGKDVFNVLNTVFIGILLYFMYRFSDMNKSNNVPFYQGVLFSFIFLWTFFGAWYNVFLWQSGSCSYLWTICVVFLFLLPYIKVFYKLNIFCFDYKIFVLAIFILGIFAGSTNEAHIPSVLLGCVLCVGYIWKRDKKIYFWMITGILGLTLGYTAMFFSPSVPIRVEHELLTALVHATENKIDEEIYLLSHVLQKAKAGGSFPWLSAYVLKSNFIGLLVLNLWQILCTVGLFCFIRKIKSEISKEDLYFFYWLLFAATFTCWIYLFSIIVSKHGLFFSWVYIGIACLMMFRLITKDKVKVILKQVCLLITIFFIVSGSVFLYYDKEVYQDYKDFDVYMKANAGKDVVYVFPLRERKLCAIFGKPVESWNPFDIDYDRSNLNMIYSIPEWSNRWQAQLLKIHYGVKSISLAIKGRSQ